MIDNIARTNARVVLAEDLGKWSQAIKNNVEGTSLVIQWLRLHLPMQEVWVQPLVGELGSHIPHGQKKKKKQSIKQKQYCNKFNKDKKKKNAECNHGLPSDSTRFSVWLYAMIDLVWFHKCLLCVYSIPCTVLRTVETKRSKILAFPSRVC